MSFDSWPAAHLDTHIDHGMAFLSLKSTAVRRNIEGGAGGSCLEGYLLGRHKVESCVLLHNALHNNIDV